jgi:ABC transporter related
MREIIKVKNVSKVYKINKRKSGLFGAVLNLFAPRYEKKIAVSDMNFSIEEGEAVAFIGSNGAGKSTTIKMLSGILYPSEGEITVASYVPYKQRKKYVSNIGVVLGQKSQLVWDLPVRDCLEIFCGIWVRKNLWCKEGDINERCIFALFLLL